MRIVQHCEPYLSRWCPPLPWPMFWPKKEIPIIGSHYSTSSALDSLQHNSACQQQFVFVTLIQTLGYLSPVYCFVKVSHPSMVQAWACCGHGDDTCPNGCRGVGGQSESSIVLLIALCSLFHSHAHLSVHIDICPSHLVGPSLRYIPQYSIIYTMLSPFP